jgi:aryl-alcohol dehydrogenase-like predicted oxidoreductase
MKQLLLGTAQWGWTVNRTQAFDLLEAWFKAGYQAVDGATNYPINKNPDHWRASETILAEFVQAHGLDGQMQLTMKIGALDNLFSPESNLQPSFISMMAAEYLRVFGKNLHTLMFHWDNRSDATAINASLDALWQVQETYGLEPGLSGIKHPEQYAPFLKTHGQPLSIQLKHNPLHSSLRHYAAFDGQEHRYFAYGINAGGIKLNGQYGAQSTLRARGHQAEVHAARIAWLESRLAYWNGQTVRPPLRTMNQLGLVFAALHPQIHGILLGVSSVAQLQETLDFCKNLDFFDYQSVFKDIQESLS